MANLTDFFGDDIHDQNDGTNRRQFMFWSGTGAQYDALGMARDQNTIYYVTDR